MRFPTLDWDGDDASVHYTNEPGHAIPLEKTMLETLFARHDVPYDRFERILVGDFDPPGGVMTGPGGSTRHLRAEVILSGPGRCRVFRTVTGGDDSYKKFLDAGAVEQIKDNGPAGEHISTLSRLRVEAALVTDRLFGAVLAEAARLLIEQARRDGCPEGIPICVGGKPSYALPYFGPSAQRSLGAMGLLSYLRPSAIDERGSNANLAGACVVAQKAYDASHT